MTTTCLTPAEAAAHDVAAALAPSAEHLAPALTCYELNELLDLFVATGHKAAAARWIEFHDGDDQCAGHTVPAAPAPGPGKPFNISDLTNAVSVLLGDAWTAQSQPWGNVGILSGPFTTSFLLEIDYDDALTLSFDPYVDDAFPEDPALPEDFEVCDEGVYLAGASPSDGLKHLAEKYAAAVRAITGT
ncbi:hypothetical protein ACFV2V_25150 [Streptomyces sp. NPDC059698]|uniref:hypothetical protein n=1 Tax=Streptomyces TaxID=1883 RepID=UPI00093E1CAB|nr:hypothetical protein [Streptomyces sp. CB02366]OKJ25237.1 hypothetical protein AMK24_31715 [Streptomyces sp. CB02366]